MKEPFLRFIAKEYIKHRNLNSYCFIFPNRRSGTFFAKELHDAASQPTLSPEITTISNFVSDITDSIEVNRIESLFILFNAYRELAPNSALSFDKFAHWGDVILNDFGDVDRYCVDAKDLFVNIAQLKQIKSNYLDQETKEKIGHVLNFQQYTAEYEAFWQHIITVDGEVKIKEKFTSIWDLLLPLYQAYNKKLEEARLSYNGKMFRTASEIIKAKGKNDFNFSKYVFIGFNVLSESEYRIFKAMKEKGFAEFHWDYNSPAFDSPQNKGTKFLSNYIKEFKAPFEEEKIDSFPKNITAIGIPSNYGQTKFVGKILESLINSNAITDTNNAIDTAIVLPDEGLFMPLLRTFNGDPISNVNITMGLSIKNSSIASLMSTISRLHFQARKTHGEFNYFHADVKDVLLHPIVKFKNQGEAQRLIDHITTNNMYQVPFSIINEYAPNLAKLFTVVDNFSAACVVDYIRGILDFTGDVLQQQLKSTNEATEQQHDETTESEFQNITSVEIAFLDKYREGLEQIVSVVEAQAAIDSNFKIDINTFCFLLDRLLSSTTIPFEGEPLGGLQIMGILETRCLDFKNIIILSMNERIFPRRHFNKSFIPSNLRAANSMSTVEHQESMYAYYFYRMINRAENVFMLFDSRTQGGKSGEESRFIRQLHTLYGDNCNIKRIMLSQDIKAPATQSIVVKKDKRIMDILKLYKESDEDQQDEKTKAGKPRMLSAHSINVFIDCPLRFYLHYIEGLSEIDEVSEFMEASTFGTIVHETMQNLYPDGKDITQEYIDELQNKSPKYVSGTVIGDTIIKKINEHFLRKGKDCLDSLFGESLLKYDIVYEFVRRVLNYDKVIIANSKRPIHFIQGEKELTCKVKAGEHTFNLQYTIDRLDEVTEADGTTYTRIVDYKTGKDAVEFNSIDALFNSNDDKRPHAILQLLLYCNAYSTDEAYNGGAIKPIIYKITEMDKSGIKYGEPYKEKKQFIFPKSGSKNEFLDINDNFMNKLGETIDNLFNEDIPFTQTTNDNNCKYCKFKDFCRKE